MGPSAVAVGDRLAHALEERIAAVHACSSFQRSRKGRAAGAGKSRTLVQPPPGPGKARNQPAFANGRSTTRAKRSAQRYSNGRRSTTFHKRYARLSHMFGL